MAHQWSKKRDHISGLCMAVVKVQLALTSTSWDMFHRLALEVFLRVQLAGFPPKPKQISERIRGFFSFWPDGRSILEIVRVNRVCSQVTGLFSRMTLKMCYPSKIKLVLSFDSLWCEDLMIINMIKRTTHALRAFYHFPVVGKRRTISNFGQIFITDIGAFAAYWGSSRKHATLRDKTNSGAW